MSFQEQPRFPDETPKRPTWVRRHFAEILVALLAILVVIVAVVFL